MENTKPKNPNEHAFLNILCNILLPILILNKGNVYLGSVPSLVIALLFPLSYGIFELVKKRKFNMFSVLGLFNVGVTGGLALSGKGGLWFAVKDAAFPGLIGIFVFGSAFTAAPFIKTIFLNPTLVKIDTLEKKLRENSNVDIFERHLRLATLLLSSSFLLSAVVNFILAREIFAPIDEALPGEQRAIILNEQIAKMTSTSMLVIMVPSIVFMLGLFWYLFHGIKKMTGLTAEELLHN